MEADLMKYFAFLFSSVLLLGILVLWLKFNKIKRKKEDIEIERLEVQKELYKKAVEKNKDINSNSNFKK